MGVRDLLDRLDRGRTRECSRCGANTAKKTCCGTAHLAACASCGHVERWDGRPIRSFELTLDDLRRR